MTSYSKADGPAEQFGRARWQGRCGGSMRWRPLEIAAMVIGFAIYWPIGLAILGLKIAQRRGYKMDDAVASVRSAFGRFTSPGAADTQWRPFSAGSGNAAFDEWRAAELAKLEEERRKLDAAQREFGEHLDNLRRARDREEFEGFMNTRNQTRPSGN